MKTYILMRKDEFALCLMRDFNGESFEIYFGKDDFWSYGGKVEYKNIKIYSHSGARFTLAIGKSRLIQNAENRDCTSFYFVEGYETSWKCVRRDFHEIVKVIVQGQGQANVGKRENTIDIKEQKILSLYNEKIEEYKLLYNKIQDKDFFEMKFKLFIESFLDKEYFNEIYSDILLNLKDEKEVFPYFLEKYISWEECYYYIRENMSVENLKKAYPELEQFCLSKEEIENIVEWEKSFFSLRLWSERDEDQSWLLEEKKKGRELRKILDEIYLELFEKNENWRKKQLKEKLKSKYTLEYVLENNKDNFKTIENFSDMKYFLGVLLKEHDFFIEKELTKEIENFFIRYKKHEEEYNEFIRQVGQDRYIVKYDELKETRYHAGIYTEDEEMDARYMNKLLSCFYERAYVKGTTKYRPYLEREPFWAFYVKELISVLVEYGVLKEVNEGFEFYKPENMEQISKEKLYYSEWEKGASFLNYKQQRILEKEKKYQNKISTISELILSDEKFLECKCKKDRVRYLRDFIIKEFEEGRDNYFYCLDAYRDRKYGVCFQSEKARKLLEDLWKIAKKKKIIKS